MTAALPVPASPTSFDQLGAKLTSERKKLDELRVRAKEAAEQSRRALADLENARKVKTNASIRAEVDGRPRDAKLFLRVEELEALCAGRNERQAILQLAIAEQENRVAAAEGEIRARQHEAFLTAAVPIGRRLNTAWLAVIDIAIELRQVTLAARNRGVAADAAEAIWALDVHNELRQNFMRDRYISSFRALWTIAEFVEACNAGELPVTHWNLYR